jgi:hypothetical protein
MVLLQLFALCGFAVAQPLLGVLGPNPTFFVAHGSGTAGVIAFAVGLIVVPPAVLAAAVLAIQLVSARVARLIHTVIVGALAAIALTPPIARRFGSPLGLYLLIFLTIAVAAMIAFSRSALVRRYVTILAVAPVAFVVLFLFVSNARTLITASEPRVRAAAGDARTPVVMFVMDEFSHGSILEPDGSIDQKRFPNFAALASRATWYPNATTNSNQTETALPAMLSGTYPRSGHVPPTASNYPNNLFSLVEASHRLAVDEWLTAMCPPRACPQSLVTYKSPKHLAADSALVLANVLLPPRITAVLPPLLNRWAGYFASPAGASQRASQFPAIVRPAARALLDWLADEDFGSLEVRRFDAFEESIRRGREPTLWFVHLALPHQPWHLLPDARPYDAQETPGLQRNKAVWDRGVFAEAALQRYEMQVEATDRLVGRLIRRLDDEGLWDRSLVIALADHGVVFRPGRSTRAVRGAESDILPIPLFVKYPGQREGRVDRRNAELIDVLPTIADVLDVRVPWTIDGSSLEGPDPHRATKRVWSFGDPLPPYDTDVADGRIAVAQRIRSLFGRWTGDGDLFGWGPHRKLVGTQVADQRVSTGARATVTLDEATRWGNVRPSEDFTPARVFGTVHNGGPSSWIAVAINGVIAGLGEPWPRGEAQRFAVMIDDALLKPGRNELSVFGVDAEGRLIRFRVTS